MQSFPPLRLAVLSALSELKDHIDANPEFLDGPDIPYDGDTKALLKKILEPKTVTLTVEKEVKVAAGRGRPTKDITLSAEDQQKVNETLQKLMKDLEEMNYDQMETNERIQVTKLKAGIVEQLLKLQERLFNIKRMSEFQQVVVTILDDLVDEKGRETFLNRIEPYRVN